MELAIVLGIYAVIAGIGMYLSRHDSCDYCSGGKGVDFHTKEVHHW